MDELVIAKKSDLVEIADAIRNKTGTSETLSLDEMAVSINELASEPALTTLVVNPGKDEQHITPTETFDGFSDVVVVGDADLIAGNIKNGVTIFNVTGSLKGGPNLSVMGGTTQPAGTENMVWINTGTAISSYVFSATEPTNPIEGMVWVTTSTVAPVPIDTSDENTVLIYPILCQQYISGAWVTKTAKTYQDGQWKDWGKTLYNYGVTDLEFSFSTDYASNGLLQSNYIHLESTNKYGGTVSMSTSPAINLTPYTVAKIEIENTGGYATMTIGFGATVGALNEANWSYQGEMAKQTVTIDISSLSDSHYLSASRVTNSDSRGVGVTKIWSIRLE